MAKSKMAAANRLAIVTGGGNGIGKAVCRLLAREGASVVVLDIQEEAARSTANSLHCSSESVKHTSFTVDVSSREQVVSVLKKAREVYSRSPCIVVNSAGIAHKSMMAKVSENEFDEVISVNLKGTFLVSQAASKAMIEDKAKGSIVNISSIVAKCGNIALSHYAASKGGIVSFTKSCALELARYGIRCNVVLPGFIQTNMTGEVPENIKDQLMGLIPLGRMGQPEDIAEVCVFLASDKSSYMTGSCVEVTGGLAM